MKLLKWWHKDETDGKLQKMENLLQQNLVRVTPRQDFVKDLRKNLLNQIPQEVELALSNQRKKLQTGLVVSGGILGGILLILTGMRGIVSLVGIFSLLINWFRQNGTQTQVVEQSPKAT